LGGPRFGVRQALALAFFPFLNLPLASFFSSSPSPQFAAALAAIEAEMGPVDVLVCNAGASVPGVCEKERGSGEEWWWPPAEKHRLSSIHPSILQTKKRKKKKRKKKGRFLEQDPAVSRRTMDLNYFGVETAVRAVLPGMVARRAGKVVFIASAMAVCGSFFFLFFLFLGGVLGTKKNDSAHSPTLSHSSLQVSRASPRTPLQNGPSAAWPTA
jgi:NAD(P)-dependent dehydrogenase (short-subunit alcohol dehydrogenase family)